MGTRRESASIHRPSQTMTTSLQRHLDSISSTSSSISSLPFNTIPTHFISSLLHQSGVDNLIRDPHPHERGLFSVRTPRQKENIPINGDSESKVLRTRSEKPGISPLLLAKYSAGGNVEADVFLNSVDRLLEI
jgi:DASH complex subunit Spc34